MRRLTATLVLGVTVALALITGGGAAGQTAACPGQSVYGPNQAGATAAAAVTAATSSAGLGSIAADGTVNLSFNSSVCAGFRIVLRAKEIRPGNPGYPRHDGYTTVANVLTHVPAGPTTVTFMLNQRGLDLLNYARSGGQSVIVFVIAHVRRDGSSISSEAIQIVSVS